MSPSILFDVRVAYPELRALCFYFTVVVFTLSGSNVNECVLNPVPAPRSLGPLLPSKPHPQHL